MEVYTDDEPQWRPCCRVCYHQRRQSVARTLDELRGPGMVVFRKRTLIRNRPQVRKRSEESHTSDGQQLGLFE
jgi:hypothetical protein